MLHCKQLQATPLESALQRVVFVPLSANLARFAHGQMLQRLKTDVDCMSIIDILAMTVGTQHALLNRYSAKNTQARLLLRTESQDKTYQQVSSSHLGKEI